MEATTRKNSQAEALAAGLAPMVDRVAAGAHDAVDKAASAANSAVDKAASAAAAAARVAGEKGEQLNALQERYLDGARSRVRDNPLAAVGVALAAGFLVSFLLSRR